jgi:hypothetical protein
MGVQFPTNYFFVATFLTHSTCYHNKNYRKYDSEERRSNDVNQESARTTVSQKNTPARMTSHSNWVLIDFHSLTPKA